MTHDVVDLVARVVGAAESIVAVRRPCPSWQSSSTGVPRFIAVAELSGCRNWHYRDPLAAYIPLTSSHAVVGAADQIVAIGNVGPACTTQSSCASQTSTPSQNCPLLQLASLGSLTGRRSLISSGHESSVQPTRSSATERFPPAPHSRASRHKSSDTARRIVRCCRLRRWGQLAHTSLTGSHESSVQPTRSSQSGTVPACTSRSSRASQISTPSQNSPLLQLVLLGALTHRRR